MGGPAKVLGSVLKGHLEVPFEGSGAPRARLGVLGDPSNHQ